MSLESLQYERVHGTTDANRFQAACEAVAEKEYDRRGQEFSAWLHEIYIPDNADTITALVCLAGGSKAERVAAAVMSDAIHDDFIRWATEADWCRHQAKWEME